jgi:23S rRNA (adenine2503-C2)-methyltransferase
LHVTDKTVEELAAALAPLGAEPYRARQVVEWVFRKGVLEAEGMTSLPAALRGKLRVTASRVVSLAESRDGALKLLVAMEDGQHVETVLIPTSRFATACLSTQAGCAMGCAFCASGIYGLARNLGGGEIIEQFLHLWRASATRPTHVVFMGMGEPLANYDATVFAIRALLDPSRGGLSARRITVSTVGLPAAIRRLGAEGLPINLAISLHAPDDELRRQLIPSARGTSIDSILSAADDFRLSRNREVTLEYVLLEGVNDSAGCAEGLARLATRHRCGVNLIRYNPVEGLPYRGPSAPAADAFVRLLRKHGASARTRASRGLDAQAACGQLRRSAAPAGEPDQQSKGPHR